MLGRFWCSIPYRAFSKSSFWRNLEKAKPPEPPVEANPGVLDMSVSVVPTEFDKMLLVFSGKYKSKKDIPPRVGYDTMNNAKSKVRIKLANVMMATTVFACIAVVYQGKKKQREGDSLLKRMTERESELREEGRLRKQK